MVSNLVSYFNADGTPTQRGLEAFRSNVQSIDITRMIVLTQGEYDSLPTPRDPRTLFLVTT